MDVIKKYMASLKRMQFAPQKFYFPDLYSKEIKALTRGAQIKCEDREYFSSQELTAAYVREFDRLNNLVHVAPVFIEPAPVEVLSINLPAARYHAIAAAKMARTRRSRTKDAYFEKARPTKARITARGTSDFLLRDICSIKKTGTEWIVRFE